VGEPTIGAVVEEPESETGRTDEVVGEPTIGAVVEEPESETGRTDEVVGEPTIGAVVEEPESETGRTDEVVGEPVIAKQDGRHSFSLHRGEKATRAAIQPDPMSAMSLSLSEMSSFGVSCLTVYFQSAAKGFLNIYYTTLYSN
jgi:hypothetical protein